MRRFRTPRARSALTPFSARQCLALLNGYVQRDRLLKTPETVIKPSRWGNNAGTRRGATGQAGAEGGVAVDGEERCIALVRLIQCGSPPALFEPSCRHHWCADPVATCVCGCHQGQVAAVVVSPRAGQIHKDGRLCEHLTRVEPKRENLCPSLAAARGPLPMPRRSTLGSAFPPPRPRFLSESACISRTSVVAKQKKRLRAAMPQRSAQKSAQRHKRKCLERL